MTSNVPSKNALPVDGGSRNGIDLGSSANGLYWNQTYMYIYLATHENTRLDIEDMGENIEERTYY